MSDLVQPAEVTGSDAIQLAAIADFEEAASTLIDSKTSEHTRAAYYDDLKAWVVYCQEEQVSPATAGLKEATNFKKAQLARFAHGTVRRRLATLCSLYGVLLQGKVVSANPFHPDLLKWPSDIYEPTPAVAEETAEAILESCRVDPNRMAGVRDEALLYLMYWYGMRRSTVATLRVENLREDSTGAYLRFTTKGDKIKELVLSPEVGKVLRRWLQLAEIKAGWVFPNRQKDSYLHPVSINKIVNRRAKEAGVTVAVSPHQFRAAVGTKLYEELAAGRMNSEQEIQNVMGHSNATTSRRYNRGSQRGSAGIEALRKARGKTK